MLCLHGLIVDTENEGLPLLKILEFIINDIYEMRINKIIFLHTNRKINFLCESEAVDFCRNFLFTSFL